MPASRPIAGSLSIRLFGAFDVQIDGKELPRLRARTGHWLLALLTLRNGAQVQRDWLRDTLWPDSESDQKAAYNLRRSLSDLRKALGPHAERLCSPSVHTLSLSLTGADVDVVVFDRAEKSSDIKTLEQAVDLYRGPLLEGCIADWAGQERAARQSILVVALEKLAANAVGQQDYEQAIKYLRRLIAVDWLREDAQRMLMETLDAHGEPAAAIHVYKSFRRQLIDEFPPPHPRVEPAPQTEAHYRRIVSRLHEPPTVVPRSHDAASRLPPPNHNLPRPLTNFIGREREIVEAGERLSKGFLLTLTGPGGVGKTRLALKVAETRMSAFSDGVWLVDLAPLSDPALVPHAAAAVLGAGKDTVERSIQEVLVAYLKRRSVLLVLDNCEHLLEACAELVKTLLEACPGLRILATSRQALGLAGEWLYAVEALSLPSVRQGTPTETLMRSEAVRLFVARSHMVKSSGMLSEANVQKIGQICRRLDGLPLAIELAASKVRALSVDQIEARLDDRFQLLRQGGRANAPRQQTLRAAVDWSYDLLSPAEQELFSRTSVFAGSFSLDAAETVCASDGIDAGDVFDLLYQLVEKSLVIDEDRGGTVRFRLLETLRQYGLDRLRQSGRDVPWRERHLDYCLKLAEQAEPKLKGPDQALWHDRLDCEHDNLRAALGWAVLNPNNTEKAGRLACALRPFWNARGHQSEGRKWLAAVLLDGGRLPPHWRARVLHGAGTLALLQGDYGPARLLLLECLSLQREQNDMAGIADACANLGAVSFYQGKIAEARAFMEESLKVRREQGDAVGVADALIWLGNMAHEERDFAQSRRFFEESLAIYQLQDDPVRSANVVINLAVLAHEQEHYDLALSCCRQCLSLYRQMQNRPGIALALNNMGNILREYGESHEACRLLKESLAIRREMEDMCGVPLTLNTLGLAYCALEDFEAARASFFESGALYWKRQEHANLAYSLMGLADVASRQGQAEQAARWLGSVEALRDDIGALLSPCDQRDWARTVRSVRDALGDSRFTASWSEGRAIPLLELAVEIGFVPLAIPQP